jgi:phosphatidylserine decarboxylase
MEAIWDSHWMNMGSRIAGDNMNLELAAFGAACSALGMLVLSMKWKLPELQALVGVAAAAILTALPFVWIYPHLESEFELGVVALSQISVALAFGLLLISLRFWRDPERIPPESDRVVLSPADGEVVYIWKIAEDSAPVVSKGGRNYQLKELTGTKLTTDAVRVVGVGMSFLDVHVNRCPISGRVTLTKHIAGRFMSLGKDEAPFVNERLTTVIENDVLTVAVVQIASRLVRCVQSYLKVGGAVSAGQRLGMIRLGSLVAIVFPDRDDVQVEVTPGDHVRAGISVLARFGVGVTKDRSGVSASSAGVELDC